MGIITHDALIVTGFAEAIADAHEQATALFQAFPGLVSPLSSRQMNGYQSFGVFPDGSKEGWDHSEEADRCRDELITHLRKLGVDWVHIRYGECLGDEGIQGAEIAAASDNEL